MWRGESWACIWIDERDNSLLGVNKLFCRYTFSIWLHFTHHLIPFSKSWWGNMQLFFFLKVRSRSAPIFRDKVSNVAAASKNIWVFQSFYLLVHQKDDRLWTLPSSDEKGKHVKRQTDFTSRSPRFVHGSTRLIVFSLPISRVSFLLHGFCSYFIGSTFTRAIVSRGNNAASSPGSTMAAPFVPQTQTSFVLEKLCPVAAWAWMSGLWKKPVPSRWCDWFIKDQAVQPSPFLYLLWSWWVNKRTLWD